MVRDKPGPGSGNATTSFACPLPCSMHNGVAIDHPKSAAIIAITTSDVSISRYRGALIPHRRRYRSTTIPKCDRVPKRINGIPCTSSCRLASSNCSNRTRGIRTRNGSVKSARRTSPSRSSIGSDVTIRSSCRLINDCAWLYANPDHSKTWLALSVTCLTIEGPTVAANESIIPTRISGRLAKSASCTCAMSRSMSFTI